MNARLLRRRAGEVVANRPLGAYRQVSVVLPALPGPARPGQFVIVSPGRPDRVLPRTWWLAGERTEAGFGSTLELVVPDGEPGEPALPEAGDQLELTGPLGRGFGLPTTAVTAIVATEGAAGAVGRWLAERLRDSGSEVHLLSCAADPEQHVDLVQARRVADGVVLSHPDQAGSALVQLAQRTAASVLYAAGPLALSATVARVAAQTGVVSQVTGVDIGGPGVCGHGLCGGCELPLISGRRVGARVRPCSEGPVLRGDLVDWSATGAAVSAESAASASTVWAGGR